MSTLPAPETRDAFDALVAGRDGLLVLFTGSSCSVADAVEPKLLAMAAERFPALDTVVIPGDGAAELQAQLGVFVFPTVVAYFGGRETARFVRTFAVDAVAEALARPYSILFCAPSV